MYNFKDIQERSVSENELMVCYADAIKLLHLFEKNDTQVLGWEGWLKYENGSIGPSQKYQGTVDLSEMTNTSAIALVKSTIMQAHAEWEKYPEVNGAVLLFCIITKT